MLCTKSVKINSRETPPDGTKRTFPGSQVIPTYQRTRGEVFGDLIRLKRNECYQDYDEVIKNQLEKGVVEPAPAVASGKEFYIPH